MRSSINLIVFLCIAAIIFAHQNSFANPIIGTVEAFWEDSLAVIRPEINDPFRQEIWDALLSGLNIVIDLELQMIRIGYVKRESYKIVVEHDVWKNQFRVTAPVGTFVINDYSALEHYFKHNLGLFVNAGDLPYYGSWLIKVRVGEGRILHNNSKLGSNRVEAELKGIAAWLFKWTKPKTNFSEWSPLVRLPDPVKGE